MDYRKLAKIADSDEVTEAGFEYHEDCGGEYQDLKIVGGEIEYPDFDGQVYLWIYDDGMSGVSTGVRAYEDMETMYNHCINVLGLKEAYAQKLVARLWALDPYKSLNDIRNSGMWIRLDM